MDVSPCPDPLARAPRVDASQEAPRQWLLLPPPELQGALLALVGRDTHGSCLDAAQRLTHFPASPMVSISWFPDVKVGTVGRDADGDRWRPFDARVVVAGTQSQPVTSWAEKTGRGYIAIFAADAAKTLFDCDLATIQDRFSPADTAMHTRWQPLWRELVEGREADLMAVLERHLAPRWQTLHGRSSGKPSLRQLGHHWIDRLGWHARQWRREGSARHVERRIRAFSGRSLREWRGLVRTESLFFAARDRHDSDQPLRWAELAQLEGFSDQAHMIRLVKRITGFSPTDFASRFIEDESFWLYRLWV